MAELLLELFSEEIPARMQRPAAAQLRERFLRAAQAAELAHEFQTHDLQEIDLERAGNPHLQYVDSPS